MYTWNTQAHTVGLRLESDKGVWNDRRYQDDNLWLNEGEETVKDKVLGRPPTLHSILNNDLNIESSLWSVRQHEGHRAAVDPVQSCESHRVQARHVRDRRCAVALHALGLRSTQAEHTWEQCNNLLYTCPWDLPSNNLTCTRLPETQSVLTARITS